MTVRVLQVLGRSAGGIARHVAEITSALDGQDLVVDIAGPNDLPIAMPKDVLAVTIPDGPFGHRGPIRRLRGLIATGRYSVVHAHGLRAGIDAAIAGKGRVHVIVTVHNLVRAEVSGRVKATLYRPAESLVVRSADKVLAVSRDIANHLSTIAGDARGVKIEVLHLGVEPTRRPSRDRASVRRELGIEEGRRLVVTASRLSAQKALHVMIDAMEGLDAELAILGEGPDEAALRERARGRHNVRFLGFRRDVTDVIAAADVFCLSSVWEGVPLAAMEAVQLGVPVVATDVGGTGELIDDNLSGRLVRPGDPAALRGALAEVLDDGERAASFVRAAREKLATEFSTPRMLARLRELYTEAGR